MILLRLLLAAAGGALAYTSYEPHGYWFLGLVGAALFIGSLVPWGTASSKRAGALLGVVHFLTCYLLLLPWVGEFVGALPYVALAVTEALYGALIGAAGVVMLRSRLWAPFFPFAYVAVEFLRSSWPFGGFAWVRLAWGQINGPLALLAPVGGPALVTFAAVLAALGLTLVASRRFVLGVSLVLVVLLTSISALPLTNSSATDTGERVTVAAIQGNVPRMGLDFNAQQRAVLANHVESTKKVTEPVDLVIWPENSSDVNPFADKKARALIEEAVASVQAPVVVGTITRDEVGPRNTMVVFDPKLGTGEYHHKKYLQPFGEWMPFRSFFRLFSPYVDQAGNFKPGDGNGVVHMVAATLGRTVAVGIATCYEVAFDAAYRDAVRAGAQLLATPTNNATFGFTDMTYQQLAMSRFRAKELDRAVVVAATSGVSAIVAPDGSVRDHSEIFTQDQLVASLPLKQGLTPAARWGGNIQWGLTIVGILAFICAALTARRRPGKDRVLATLTTVPSHSKE